MSILVAKDDFISGDHGHLRIFRGGVTLIDESDPFATSHPDSFEPWLGGGGSPSTQTADLTTDPDAFAASHLFDVEAARLVYWKMTVLALTPDGETFGDGSGEIGVDGVLDNASGGVESGVSRDNTTFVAIAGATGLHTAIPTDVDDFVDGVIVVPRYAKIAAFIYDNDTGEKYAGANNPTAQVRVDIEYL